MKNVLKPKVSVITPTFNSEKSLLKCLNSVANQKNVEVEHILIDGGSNDGTIAILKTSPNLIWQSEPDNGVYDALNKGMKLSTGDFIAICHSDDIFMTSNFLFNAVNKILNEDTDFYYADCVYLSSDSSGLVKRYYRSGELTKTRLSFGLAPAHTTLVIKSSIVKEVGLYKVEYPICGDFEYFIRLLDRRYSYEHVARVGMLEGGLSAFKLKHVNALNQQLLCILKDHKIKSSIFNLMMRYPLKLLSSFYNLKVKMEK